MSQHAGIAVMAMVAAVALSSACYASSFTPAAEYKKGNAYTFGSDGLPQNYQKAAYWLRKAAAQGYAPAEAALGEMYFLGYEGVPKNYQKGIAWLRKAAAQGYAPADSLIGEAYASGQGVPQDHKKFLQWLKKAANQGARESARQKTSPLSCVGACVIFTSYQALLKLASVANTRGPVVSTLLLKQDIAAGTAIITNGYNGTFIGMWRPVVSPFFGQEWVEKLRINVHGRVRTVWNLTGAQ